MGIMLSRATLKVRAVAVSRTSTAWPSSITFCSAGKPAGTFIGIVNLKYETAVMALLNYKTCFVIAFSLAGGDLPGLVLLSKAKDLKKKQQKEMFRYAQHDNAGVFVFLSSFSPARGDLPMPCHSEQSECRRYR
jgi:hypothetical protein